tara:strand:+ start:282 stop:1751 length:1470 start_codon:yes stop_codon:yes gene_type:complete
MEFEERVERFFKQFKTCLGIEPDLRASFLDNVEMKIQGRPGTFREMIRSPRLPFDLTSDDKSALTKEWGAVVELDYQYTTLMEHWNVIPKYKINTEIIKIGKAMRDDGIKPSQAKLVIKEYMEEIWGDEIPPYAQGSISFCKSIYDDVCKWSANYDFFDENDRTTDRGDMGDALFKRLVFHLHQKRLSYHHNLMEIIEGRDPSQPNEFEETTLIDKEFKKRWVMVPPDEESRKAEEDFWAVEVDPETGYPLDFQYQEEEEEEEEDSGLYEAAISDSEWINEYFDLIVDWSEDPKILHGNKIKERRLKMLQSVLTKGKEKRDSNKTQAQTLGDRIPVEKMVDGIKKMFESPNNTPTDTNETTPQAQDNFLDKNKFNDKSYDFIYDHFKKGLVDGDREYLSEDKLKEWIEEAFGQYPNEPKEKYSFKNAGAKKLLIKDVFYKFYVSCGTPSKKSEKYASLCGNYFEGYNTKNVVATWHKHRNTQTKKNQNK